MTQRKEHPHIRLTSDGELWALPSAEEIREQQQLQHEATEERQRIAQELLSVREEEMKVVIERLKELNRLADRTIFLETVVKSDLIDNRHREEEVLLSRNYYVSEDEMKDHAHFLLISPHGFYIFTFTIPHDHYRHNILPSSLKNFVEMVKPETVIKDRYLTFRHQDVQLYFVALIRNESSSGYPITEKGQLLTEDDQALIEACLEKCLTPLREAQAKAEDQAAQEEANLTALQSQVVIAHRIKDILPEPLPIETEPKRWFSRWRGKKKKNTE